MKKDPFAAYRLPVSLAYGVWLEVPPARFLVRPPAQTNDQYQGAFIRRLTARGYDKNGEIIQPKADELAGFSKAAFSETCVLEAEGLPEGMAFSEFFEEYPLAFMVLYEQATALAQKVDVEVQEALGNLSGLPNGKLNGAIASKHTKRSKGRAYTSPQTVQN